MAVFDYVILGAGSAGCVLANRLSENPNNDVLLVEAGGQARSPYFHIPKIGAAVFGNERYAWQYTTQPFGPTQGHEMWPRGKVVGGSSAINGMVYNRGTQDDYDELEHLGNKDWGWAHILPAFKAFEDNQFGPSPTRGHGGPLHITSPRDPDSLCQDVIDAGLRMGLRAVDDINESDDERIGHAMATIYKGLRVSAAKAFLNPALKRPNLHLAINTYAQRLVFENGRATGVITRANGNVTQVRARREVIMALGALESPKLLQLSGIGPRDVLESAGVPIYLERDNVGRRMREHFCVINTYRLNSDLGYNKQFRTTFAKGVTTLKYLATRKGLLATPTGDVMAIFKTRPDVDRVDAQVLVTLLSVGRTIRPDQPAAIEPYPGVSCMAEVLRPTSEGKVWITSPDPDGQLKVDPNYLATEYDRKTSADLLRKIRQLFAQSPLADRVSHETGPGLDAQTDDEIVDAVLSTGTTGSHAIGTCAMGPGDDDIVDDRLRVRGIAGLRIVDCSIMPSMISGNLNGPTMAMAWRAADLILDTRLPRSVSLGA
jgi:choline dehydrogenase